MSVHNCERRLRIALQNFEQLDISTINKKMIKDFLHFLSAQGVGVAR